MSSKCIRNTYEINIRYAHVLRFIGRGKASGTSFSAVMNLSPPNTKFEKYNTKLLAAVTEVCEASMRHAAKEVVLENEGRSDVADAFDGTWQKRGHISMDGVGSSGGMDVAGATALSARFEHKFGLSYVQYLGDGESKGLAAVIQNKPYGNNVDITKLECVAHVKKRQKLGDGKGLGEKRRLADAQIDQLQHYYGQSIRKNLTNVEDMSKAIWAIYFHKISTDANPQHFLCPPGDNSWCKFNQTKAKKQENEYTQQNSLPEAVMAAIGLQILKLGVADGIVSFNEGSVAKVNVLERLQMKSGKFMMDGLKAIDAERRKKADKEVQEENKKKRVRTRLGKRTTEDSESYCLGGF
ncbi:hypothetical protein PR048_008273 [Dryococelus australis]|uniref:Mutator-like transposase domain-containing protein n=1 Tax=Dryococelus australis TaxID=614101 RepID=A0ABQ9HWN0_9NEOP|nr:hypothetical protein PR048_008273 [Dryococelus australis]